MSQETKKANSTKVSGRLRLRITAAAETQVRAGHPWVFGDSVLEQNRDGESGELSVIYDRKDKFLAVGFYDPDSPIRVRVLHTGKPQTIDNAFWQVRLDEAVRRRAGLFDERTTGYRLINGESDGWPGLVLDRYDTTLVMKIYTTGWLIRLEEVSALIRARLQPERVALRTSRNVQSIFDSPGTLSPPGPLPLGGEGESLPAAPRVGAGEILHGPGIDRHGKAETGAPVVFLESGLRFEADILRGQKTGFFLDQRENRRIVETLARGRTMLNAFSFSGGFALYAVRGGAKAVTDLDISAHTLKAAKRNFELNQNVPAVVRCQHELVQADAFVWLADNPKRKFDLIVLDPPSLAKREAERMGATRAYARLTELGIKHLSPSGILLACSCSAHVSADEFFGAVRQSATKSGRRFTELQATGHAPDHPATFKEAEYLKGIYLKFD